jgi:Ion channel
VPDAESAFYLFGVTYATIEYGDLLLPKPWRMLGPVEGLTGILMCGLSAGLFWEESRYAALGRPRGRNPRFCAERAPE